MLADQKRIILFHQLLNYDMFICFNAARNFADRKIWLSRNEDGFLKVLDFSSRGTADTEHSAEHNDSIAAKKFKCSWCHGSGHFKKDCPAFNVQSRSLVICFFEPVSSKAGQKKIPTNCVLNETRVAALAIPAPPVNTIACSAVYTAPSPIPRCDVPRNNLRLPLRIFTPLQPDVFETSYQPTPTETFSVIFGIFCNSARISDTVAQSSLARLPIQLLLESTLVC